MYEPLRRLALAFLKVPPEPHPPMGDPASLRVFRAGRNYYRLRMAVWGVAQFLALAAFLFWTVVLLGVGQAVIERQQEPTRPLTNEVSSAPDSPESPRHPSDAEERRPRNGVERFAQRIESAAKSVERTQRAEGGPGGFRRWVAGVRQFALEFALLLPAGIFPLIWVVKIASFILYLAQIPVTYAIRRFDFELRWYMVTDRSLRLRHGVWKVVESTMNFANIQQVVVSEGPVQRLLGLADVKVKSAGGGGEQTSSHGGHSGEDMHLATFRNVTNASEIRDLILARLRLFRETGLGDPDDPARLIPTTPHPTLADALAAARELADELRAVQRSLS